MAPDITIRAARPSDIAGLTALANLPGYRHGTLRMPFETEEALAKRFFGGPGDVVFLVAEHRDGTIVGSASLARLAKRRGHVGTIGMGVHDEHRRQGIGRALLAALLDVADNWLGLRRLELEVNTDNEAAIGLYRSLGFAVEGTAREAILRDGILVDSHWMARLRGAPEGAR